MSRLVLGDTTILNNFAQVGRPDLLRAAFPKLAAPPEVLSEIAEGERLGLVPKADWSWLVVLDLKEHERRRAAQFGSSLQAGESACLALAETRTGVVLTDDGAARRQARLLNIELSGTLGVLVRLVSQATLSPEEGDELLSRMIECGYRCPVRSLREILHAPPPR